MCYPSSFILDGFRCTTAYSHHSPPASFPPPPDQWCRNTTHQCERVNARAPRSFLGLAQISTRLGCKIGAVMAVSFEADALPPNPITRPDLSSEKQNLLHCLPVSPSPSSLLPSMRLHFSLQNGHRGLSPPPSPGPDAKSPALSAVAPCAAPLRQAL